MPRLRTTSLLSAFALFVGVAATSWLSGLTYRGTPPRMARVRHEVSSMHRIVSTTRHSHHAIGSDDPHAAVRRAPDSGTLYAAGVRAAIIAPATGLVPLDMPADTSQSWSELRGHLDGEVVLQIDTDDAGRVRYAAVAASSGDPVLDEHALRSVKGWRFVVPADHPGGLSGELPMRFSTGTNPLADASE